MENIMINEKINFINNYISSKNAADGSKYDANANVTSKNICTLQSELFKKEMIQINRKMMFDRLSQLYDADIAKEYIKHVS